MENSVSWEHETLIGELIQGMEVAKQLREQLKATSSIETKDFLVQRILSSYEKALFILNWSGALVKQPPTPQPQALVGVDSETPISMNNASPTSDELDGGYNDFNSASKKRKTMSTWNDQVRVSNENRLEGPHEDGFSWRKYGQKEILGSRYPRSYYRCSYRNTKNCWATKQVQRTDEDPKMFDVKYRGTHTCHCTRQPQSSAPVSPESQPIQEQNNRSYEHNRSEHALPYASQTNPRVLMEGLDCNYDSGSSFTSTPFTSPVMPDQNNYYSTVQADGFDGFNQNMQQSSETELACIISGMNSQVLDVEIASHNIFLFNNSQFFA